MFKIQNNGWSWNGSGDQSWQVRLVLYILYIEKIIHHTTSFINKNIIFTSYGTSFCVRQFTHSKTWISECRPIRKKWDYSLINRIFNTSRLWGGLIENYFSGLYIKLNRLWSWCDFFCRILEVAENKINNYKNISTTIILITHLFGFGFIILEFQVCLLLWHFKNIMHIHEFKSPPFLSFLSHQSKLSLRLFLNTPTVP